MLEQLTGGEPRHRRGGGRDLHTAGTLLASEGMRRAAARSIPLPLPLRGRYGSVTGWPASLPRSA